MPNELTPAEQLSTDELDRLRAKAELSEYQRDLLSVQHAQTLKNHEERIARIERTLALRTGGSSGGSGGALH